jgi:acyl-CoA synthetase (AMP-forming)/AMP-acid ligase II
MTHFILIFCRSGDLLEMDDLGFVYFVDRCGDTFRWKSENVSTLEVEGLLAPIVAFRDVVVYGVQVPDTEGRAGMAAIGGTGEIDFKSFYGKIVEKLPFYALPIFLRVGSDLEVTGEN